MRCHTVAGGKPVPQRGVSKRRWNTDGGSVMSEHNLSLYNLSSTLEQLDQYVGGQHCHIIEYAPLSPRWRCVFDLVAVIYA